MTVMFCLKQRRFADITLGEEDLNTLWVQLSVRIFFEWSYTVQGLSQICNYKRPRVCVFTIVNVCCSHLSNVLTFVILWSLCYVGIIPKDIKNLYKNQEIEHKLITDRKLSFHYK